MKVCLPNNVDIRELVVKKNNVFDNNINKLTFGDNKSNIAYKKKCCPNIDEIIHDFNNEIKVFFIDIDGTIRDYNGNVPINAKEGLKKLQKNNVKIILSTGRSILELENVIDEIGIKCDYYITQQGGSIVNSKGEILFQNTLDDLDVKKIIDLYNQYKKTDENINLILYIDGKPTSTSNNANLPTNMNSNNPLETKIVSNFDVLFNQGKKATKALFYKSDSKNMENMNPLCDFLSKNIDLDRLLVFNSGIWYCEITNKNISKGFGVEYICKKLGFELKNASVIGDAQNDMEMMKITNSNGGLAIAMGNSEPCVFNLANCKTDHIDNDGYYKAICYILDNNRVLKNPLFKFIRNIICVLKSIFKKFLF